MLCYHDLGDADGIQFRRRCGRRGFLADHWFVSPAGDLVRIPLQPTGLAALLAAGLLCLAAAVLTQGLLSILLGLIGVAFLWSIREIREQARRVERGWFPKNPNRK